MDLTEEEVAFYDIVSQGKEAILNDEAKEIARELVRIIKNKTEGQCFFKDQEELDNIVKMVIEQAVALFEDAA